MPRIRTDWRKHLILILVALVIALAILFIQTESASALCESLTPEEKYEHADFVFTGEVERVDTENLAPGSQSAGGLQPRFNLNTAAIQADTVWKGDIHQTYNVAEWPQTAETLGMHEGAEYLFFARYTDDGVLATHLCLGSAPTERASDLIAFLGEGTRTDDATTSQITGDDYQSAVTTERLLILGMLALVVLTWLYLRWRPPPGHEEDPERERPPNRE